MNNIQIKRRIEECCEFAKENNYFWSFVEDTIYIEQEKLQ
jgi:hypothetical protein